MNIFTDKFSLLNNFFKSTPCTIPIILFIIYFFNKSMYIFYLILGWFFMDYIVIGLLKNIIFKNLGNYLSNIYEKIDFPIIGRFKRPEGAANCGCFYVNETNYSYTQGMPSGHSTLSAFVAVFMYNYIINQYNIKPKYRPIIFIITLSFILYTMYSRVIVNCHTIQQTIIGSLIGGIFGYYYYFYVMKLIEKEKNKNK